MKILEWFLALGAGAITVCSAAGTMAQPPADSSPARKPAQLVILDTDIGDDIDDAFALALVLRSPELKVLGITTAYGDTELRARLVDRYLDAVGRGDIPVAGGEASKADNVFTQAAYARMKDAECTASLASRTDANRVCQVGGRTHRDAVGFLLDQIREHPGEMTLIAIGPLNNIQEAIQRDPQTFQRLKRVVMMGGSIYRGYDGPNGERRPPDAEWNINRDPAGLKALLDSGVPIFMMPLDSTQIHLNEADREKIFAHGSSLTDQLTLLYHEWKGGNDGHAASPTLYDPVAVTYAIRPDLCAAARLRIEVDDKGYTRPVDGTPNVQVCLKSDEKGFLELLETRLLAEPAP